MAIKISGTIVIDDSRNIVNAGVVTATSFIGDGSGIVGVGIGSTSSVNTTGIITASIVSANQFMGSGDNLVFSPTITTFNPTDGATDVSFFSQIILTFDQPIYAGVGTITLRNSSGIGTIIQSIGIGSTSVSISSQTLTITPNTLPAGTDVYVVLPQGVVKNAVGGNIATLSTYNFTTTSFTLSSINPGSGSTNIGVTTNVTLAFSSTPFRGTGTVSIRSGSAGGTTIETFDAAASARIAVSGNDWILDPTSNLDAGTTFFTVIPSTAITNYAGLNTTGGASHCFTTTPPSLGGEFGGGYLICQSSGTRWIVAPSSSQVSRSHGTRNDAITTAQQVSGCTGWFVPSISQLQNPGYACRSFWDSYNLAAYRSDTLAAGGCSCVVNFNTGGPYGVMPPNQPYAVRALRCVSY